MKDYYFIHLLGQIQSKDISEEKRQSAIDALNLKLSNQNIIKFDLQWLTLLCLTTFGHGEDFNEQYYQLFFDFFKKHILSNSQLSMQIVSNFIKENFKNKIFSASLWTNKKITFSMLEVLPKSARQEVIEDIFSWIQYSENPLDMLDFLFKKEEVGNQGVVKEITPIPSEIINYFYINGTPEIQEWMKTNLVIPKSVESRQGNTKDAISRAASVQGLTQEDLNRYQEDIDAVQLMRHCTYNISNSNNLALILKQNYELDHDRLIVDLLTGSFTFDTKDNLSTLMQIVSFSKPFSNATFRYPEATPLQVMVKVNYYHMDMLLNGNVDININHVAAGLDDENPKKLHSALSLAASGGNSQLAKRLLKLGADAKLPNNAPIFYACCKQDFELYKMFYDKGARLAQEDIDKFFLNNKEIFNFFNLEGQQSQKAKDTQQFLHDISNKRISSEAIKTHLEDDLYIEEVIPAALKEKPEILDYILSNGLFFNFEEVLSEIILSNNLEALKVWIKYNKPLDKVFKSTVFKGKTPLIAAIDNNSYYLTGEIFDLDDNKLDSEYRKSVLWAAINNSDEKIIKKCSSLQAPHETDQCTQAFFEKALEENNVAILSFLLNFHGLKYFTNLKFFPECAAAKIENCSDEICKLLLPILLTHNLGEFSSMIFTQNKDGLESKPVDHLSPRMTIYSNNDAYNISASVQYTKGNPLFVDANKEIPVGYNVHLPPSGVTNGNILIECYGGNAGTVYDPGSMHEVLKDLLQKGTIIITLNLPDLLKLKVYLGQMPEELHKEIQEAIHYFITQLKVNPDLIHSDLTSLHLDKMKTFLFGASFGGEITVRHAQMYPNDFNGYISHNGPLSSEAFVASDRHHREAFNPWLDPAVDTEIDKITKPILIMQNRDDNNVNAKTAFDFYNKLAHRGKEHLVRLGITEVSSPMPRTPHHNKGHHFPTSKIDFDRYVELIRVFMTKGVTDLPQITKWQAYRQDLLANKHFKGANLQQRFIAEVLEKSRFDQALKKDLNDVHKSKQIKSLYYAMNYTERLNSSSAFVNEVARLKSLNLPTLIMLRKALLNFANLFLDYVFELCGKKFTPQSMVSDDMLETFKQMIFTPHHDLNMLKFIFNQLYTANPELLESLHPQFEQDPNLQESYRLASAELQSSTSQQRKMVLNIWRASAKLALQKERLGLLTQKIKEIQQHEVPQEENYIALNELLKNVIKSGIYQIDVKKEIDGLQEHLSESKWLHAHKNDHLSWLKLLQAGLSNEKDAKMKYIEEAHHLLEESSPTLLGNQIIEQRLKKLAISNPNKPKNKSTT